MSRFSLGLTLALLCRLTLALEYAQTLEASATGAVSTFRISHCDERSDTTWRIDRRWYRTGATPNGLPFIPGDGLQLNGRVVGIVFNDGTVYDPASPPAAFTTWNQMQVHPFVMADVLASVDNPKLRLGPSVLDLDLLDVPDVQPQPFEKPVGQYTPVRGFVGGDVAIVSYKNGSTIVATATVTINVVNTAPTVTAQVAPLKLTPGETVNVFPTVADADGHTVALSYNYGDGTSGSETTHSYTAAGVYILAISGNDGHITIEHLVSIEVVTDAARIPTARFTTSDIVGFVGTPVAFDATHSTDPQNAIVSYAWQFGDGTTGGSQIMSKVYDAAGSYSVKLTIVDGEGIQASVQRSIEILPADQLGKISSLIRYTVKFDRKKENVDSLSVDATLNVGADTVIAAGTPVAVGIAGSRFEGQLDKKLRDTTNKNEKWQVKAGTKQQAPGEVNMKVSIKKASLGLGFNQIGVLPPGTSNKTVPVLIEIAGRKFEIPIDSTFKFTKDGSRATGSGEGP